jgi:hypothetical protein
MTGRFAASAALVLAFATTNAFANHIPYQCDPVVSQVCGADYQSGDPTACNAGSTSPDYYALSYLDVVGIGLQCYKSCIQGDVEYALIVNGPLSQVYWHSTSAGCTLDVCESIVLGGCTTVSEDCPPQELQDACGNAHGPLPL